MKALAKEETVLVEAAVEATNIAAKPVADPLAAATVAAPVDDEVIRDLARRRLATKRSLIGQALDYLLIIVVAITLASFSYGDAMMVAFFFCAFWGLRLMYRAAKFMEPFFKGGVGVYLHKRKEQQLETEYNRLKKMGAEYVANELSR